MKNQKEEKESKVEVEVPALKFRFVKTKEKAYPNPLEETDYFGWKVGDLLVQGYNYNTVYQIINIFRDNLDPTLDTSWMSRVVRQQMNYQTKQSVPMVMDQKMHDLLLEYKKNGNFGACRIQIKTVLRGTQLPKRKSIKLVWEPEQVRHINYNGLMKVDIAHLHRIKDSSLGSLNNKISALESRKNNVLKHKAALDQLDNILNPKLPEVVPSGQDDIEELENPVESSQEVQQPIAILVPSQQDLVELEEAVEWVK